jgi:hypothetical protein
MGHHSPKGGYIIDDYSLKREERDRLKQKYQDKFKCEVLYIDRNRFVVLRVEKMFKTTIKTIDISSI